MPESDLVMRAREYAIRGHKRIDQRRKYTQQPYDVHLQAVALRVASVMDDDEAIAAAWLHDIIEDTPATYEDVERDFGLRVAQLVLQVTDVSRPSDGNRAARKALDRAHLAEASPTAKTIKLADLIDNCTDICRHDETFARVFLAETDALLQVLEAGDPRLLQLCKEIVSECAGQLGVSLPASFTEPELDEAGLEAHLPLHEGVAEMFTAAFAARHVAAPLHAFDAGKSREALAAEMAALKLPVAGIRVRGLVRGYVRREDVEPPDAAAAPVRSFRRDQVLRAEASLADVIEVLTRHQHCFVCALGGVAGVVTRAEIQSPIVRMWLFGMITLFEMSLGDRLRRRWPAGGWEALVSPARLEKARALCDERRRRGQESSLLDCLQFSEKALVVLEDPDQVAEFGFQSKAAAKRVIKELESLRNNLAHSQDIVLHDWPQIARLARRIQAVEARQRQGPVSGRGFDS
jgi:hypothetical protein